MVKDGLHRSDIASLNGVPFFDACKTELSPIFPGGALVLMRVFVLGRTAAEFFRMSADCTVELRCLLFHWHVYVCCRVR